MSGKTISLEMVKEAGVLLKREHELRLSFEKTAQDLEKKASALELEKRAMQIAFREVELGFSEPFETYQDLMTKVAGLVKEDLDVLEKALERGYGSGFGSMKLAESSNKPAKNAFENWVLNGELE